MYETDAFGNIIVGGGGGGNLLAGGMNYGPKALPQQSSILANNTNTFLPNLNTGGTPPPDSGGFFKNFSLFGTKDAPGQLGNILGGIQGAANLFMGMKQYGLAKEALANSKAQYEKNYAAQQATTNGRLEDRQRARVASSPTAYVGVDDYMAKNGIKSL